MPNDSDEFSWCCSDCFKRWGGGIILGIGPVCGRCGNDGLMPYTVYLHMLSYIHETKGCHENLSDKSKEFMNKILQAHNG